ncbi:hypothetical protein V1389_15240 [Flavobacterium rakeshii]|uniref:hypothetical protein n=1 Tax=Flavobacterium rakeshii TaxID=1038845 RepID=UPI002E7AB991|nr:hypothetical protein [Flavobacterium rakeshii]MEE1899700.1 hypothetical protein [Flavobacterium rakeshii]
MNRLFDDYLTGPFDKKRSIYCLLCGSESNITKEHVLPKWVFENNPRLAFTTDVNQLSQKYISTTLPMCSICNTEILNSLELYIQKTISEVDLKTKYYSPENWENIIRWFETIDYKFQLMDITTKFKAHKEAGYLSYISDLSIAEMRDFSIRTIKSKARLSLKRISIKDKSKRVNSLIVGTTKMKTFNYFHKSGQFIYLEIPKYNKVFFYFFEREFKDDDDVETEVMELIKAVYEVNE